MTRQISSIPWLPAGSTPDFTAHVVSDFGIDTDWLFDLIGSFSSDPVPCRWITIDNGNNANPCVLQIANQTIIINSFTRTSFPVAPSIIKAELTGSIGVAIVYFWSQNAQPAGDGINQAGASGSPVVTAQSANTVFAGPVSGPAAIPAFRAIDPSDLPFTNEAANLFYAGPNAGGNAPAAFRTIVLSDLPFNSEPANQFFGGPIGGGNAPAAFRALSGFDILALLANAATTLSGVDTTQPLTAGGFAGNKSISTNGYYKLPGGLIIQWGVVSVPASSQSTITFPVTFPTSGLSLVMTYGDIPNSVSIPTIAAAGEFITTSQAIIANGASSAAHSIYWIAIGF